MNRIYKLAERLNVSASDSDDLGTQPVQLLAQCGRKILCIVTPVPLAKESLRMWLTEMLDVLQLQLLRCNLEDIINVDDLLPLSDGLNLGPDPCVVPNERQTLAICNLLELLEPLAEILLGTVAQDTISDTDQTITEDITAKIPDIQMVDDITDYLDKRQGNRQHSTAARSDHQNVNLQQVPKYSNMPNSKPLAYKLSDQQIRQRPCQKSVHFASSDGTIRFTDDAFMKGVQQIRDRLNIRNQSCFGRQQKFSKSGKISSSAVFTQENAEKTLPSFASSPRTRGIVQKELLDVSKQVMRNRQLGEQKLRNALQAMLRQHELQINLANEELEKQQHLVERKKANLTKKESKWEMADRLAAIVRMNKYYNEAKDATQPYEVRRENKEELLARNIFKEVAKRERQSIRERKAYEKDINRQHLEVCKLKLESRKNYMKDQINIAKEKLNAIRDEQIQKEKDIRQEWRKLKKEQKDELRRRIHEIRSRLDNDGQDFYFRELDAKKHL